MSRTSYIQRITCQANLVVLGLARDAAKTAWAKLQEEEREKKNRHDWSWKCSCLLKLRDCFVEPFSLGSKLLEDLGDWVQWMKKIAEWENNLDVCTANPGSWILGGWRPQLKPCSMILRYLWNDLHRSTWCGQRPRSMDLFSRIREALENPTIREV